MTADPMTAQPIVLVVDDSPEDRATYRRYLEGDRTVTYYIVEAATAEEALARCQQYMPDAILMDVCLPDADGLETLQALQMSLKGTAPTSTMPFPIPAIVISGLGDEEFAGPRPWKSGANGLFAQEQAGQQVPCAVACVT
ncbi:MAG: response regulator [Coleofasciculaceae cyanobacterium SM2_3_26]|nr:response regulator [Coleofasciculaceae cyanobacterium SM2_3_26]